jgi:hypothetical protein
MTGPDDGDDGPEQRARQRRKRLEFWATVVMAVAAVLTAWSAFQSSKWRGVQSVAFAEASAARIESSRASTRAGQQTNVDVVTFTDWLGAVYDEVAADPTFEAELEAQLDGAGYDPDPRSLPGFLHDRFRDEFRPAFDAWLQSRPLRNPDAAATPFELPEYQLEQTALAEEQIQRSEQRGADAREANQRSDNYTLATVAFATVLFFAGMSTKLEADRNRAVALGLALVVLAGTATLIATFRVAI